MRRITTCLMIVLLLTLTAQTAFAAAPAASLAALPSEITVTIDGKKIAFDQAPVIIDGRTMVPMRAIFEKFGCAVGWNGIEQTAIASNENVEIKLTIGKNVLYKNKKSVSLDVPAVILNGRTLVPVRAVSEALDCTVDWQADSRTVLISGEGKIPKLSTEDEIKAWNGKSFNYDAILKGDLSQFTGVYQSEDGVTMELFADGIGPNVWYEEDGKRYKEKADSFSLIPEGYYRWSRWTEGYPGGYSVFLFPVGVEVTFDGMTAPSDTSKIRLYVGQGFSSADIVSKQLLYWKR